MSQNRFRKPRTFFTQVSNHAIDDDRLSPQAYYIYSKIQRYITIENFVLNKEYLFSKCNLGIDAFDKYWKELQHAGYLKMYQMPSEKTVKTEGQRSFTWITEYELLEQYDTSTPYYIQYNRSGEVSKVFKCTDVKSKKHDNKKTFVKPEKTVRQMVSEAQGNLKVCEGGILGGTLNNSDAKQPLLNNTLENKTLSININSSSSEEEGATLIAIVSCFKEHISKSVTSKQKEVLKELVTKYGQDIVMESIIITGETATTPNIKYLRKTCDSKVNPLNISVSKPKIKSKNTAFTNMYTHNWDLDELEKRAFNHMEKGLYATKESPEITKDISVKTIDLDKIGEF